MSERIDSKTARGQCRPLWLAAAIAVAVSCALPAFPAPAWSHHTKDAHGGKERLRDALRRHTFRGLDGETISLATLEGEVIVVNFWASWCRPCRRDLPDLDALHAELAKQGGRVVAVSIDREPDNARRFARAHSLRMPVYHDGPEKLARLLDLDHIPFTVVLSRSGEVAFTISGAGRNALAEIRATTRKLLATSPSATAVPAGGSQ